MKIEADTKLDFIDVLIRPKRSTLCSRSEVSMEKTLTFPNSNQSWTGVPIIAANMDTVGTFEMYRELSKHKLLTCLSKHYDVEDYPMDLNKEYYMVSTGINEHDWEKLVKVVEKISPKFICVDVANGYMSKLVTFVKRIRTQWPNMIIACGNVVSREMVEELIINGGADIVKVGIGSGSVCTTRIQTGVGMPQLSAVAECADAAHGINGTIISDGGVTCPGDVAKAFGGGADFVMLGSMLAGHRESAGDLIEENGKQYKVFYGMSSSTAMNKYHGGVAKYRSSEGKTVKLRYKGPVENTVNDILGGVRSTCTYIGAKRVKDIPKCCTFVRVNRQVNTIHNGKEM
uniref:GMP reductase n=1 Tax=viral metagenome TaxID=1070528 RepID=A0A6C0CQA5_9ZZZZ